MHGVSTRSVDNLVKAMGMSGVSQVLQVSGATAADLQATVDRFRTQLGTGPAAQWGGHRRCDLR